LTEKKRVGWMVGERERETGGRGVRQREREKSTHTLLCVNTVKERENKSGRQREIIVGHISKKKKKKDTRVSPLSLSGVAFIDLVWCLLVLLGDKDRERKDRWLFAWLIPNRSLFFFPSSKRERRAMRERKENNSVSPFTH